MTRKQNTGRSGSIQRFQTAPHVHWAACTEKINQLERWRFYVRCKDRASERYRPYQREEKKSSGFYVRTIVSPLRQGGVAIRLVSGKSPFCSMTDPSNGTSIVALRLMCDLLHCHVSAAKSLRAATSSKAEKRGCSRSGMHLL